ncbi:hypothetical protein AX774_g2147 [Zancudomyces culisetae]|uniref:Uncharacterized protein n=1 Tax=Zancudomyces culisetae TaxID=1213189 RepID=A0A1R1PTQ5_ZANCU|nr:hypothetical protein AX774_g2147 [Zancudomyces culisetae]|eukprot:OMH84331.1 hypothetical protein AX774_g2147 [Zancudomyces culisetae]
MKSSTYTALLPLVLARLLSPMVEASTISTSPIGPTLSTSSSSSTSSENVNCFDSVSQIEVAQGSGDSSVYSYNWDSAIDVTCSSQDFLVTFDIDQTSDIYFTIGTQKTLSTGAEIIEGVIGVNTGSWYVGSSVYVAQTDIASGAADTQKVYIRVNSSGISIGLVGNSKPILTLSPTDYNVSSFMNSSSAWLAFGAEKDSVKIQNVEYNCNHANCVNPTSLSSPNPSTSSTLSTSSTQSIPSTPSISSISSALSTSTTSLSSPIHSSDICALHPSASYSCIPDFSPTSSVSSTSSTSSTTLISPTCDSYNYDYFHIDVSSTNKNKDYDFANALTIPCDKNDFTFEAHVYTDSDFFVALMNKDGYYSPNGVIEAQFGVSSGISSIRKGKRTLVKRSSIFTRASSQTIKIAYNNAQLQIFINNSLKSTYKVSNFSMTSLAMAPFKGTAKVYSRKFYSPHNCRNIFVR